MAEDNKKDGSMSVEEAGRKGGETVARERGPEFYSEIGKKGGETVANERGPEFYSEIGRKGGHSQGKENNPGNFANRRSDERNEDEE